MPNTKDKGSITEAVCAATLMKNGYKVSIPWGENHCYDLIVDDGTELRKIQCRTGKVFGQSVTFSVSRIFYSKEHHKVVRHPKSDRIDAYAVYSPERNEVYFIPSSEISVQNQLSITEEKRKRFLLV